MGSPSQWIIRAQNHARFIIASPVANWRYSLTFVFRHVMVSTTSQNGTMIAHWMKTTRSVRGNARSRSRFFKKSTVNEPADPSNVSKLNQVSDT